MRKLILILLLFVSAVVNGQTPAGYIKANMRFKWTAGIFDSALHVPQYNGTPSGIRNGAWVGDGAIGMDTTNHRMYIYSGGAWLRLAKYSEVTTPTWQQTLTAGSTLTGDNTITSTGYDFSFNGQNIQFNATNGVDLTGTIAGTTSTISVDGSHLTLMNSRSGATSGLDIRADSIMIEPHLGLLKIDTLAAASSQNQLIGWTSTSGANRGKVGAVTIGTGLSLSSGTLNSVWTASGNDVYNNNSGNVGIGTSTPATKFHTVGTVRHQTLGTAITDTTTYKPLVINSSGDVLPSTYWYGGGGGNSVNLVFGGGSGASDDTAVFTTSAIYGSFYNESDTLYVQSMRGVLQGDSSSVTYKVWYNTSVNDESGATALVTSGSSLTSTTSGTNVTSFNATSIPPGVWVWVKTSAVTTKPTYFSLTINAKR